MRLIVYIVTGSLTSRSVESVGVAKRHNIEVNGAVRRYHAASVWTAGLCLRAGSYWRTCVLDKLDYFCSIRFTQGVNQRNLFPEAI